MYQTGTTHPESDPHQRIAGFFFILISFYVIAADAAIVSTTGGVQVLEPPPGQISNGGDIESDTITRVFYERTVKLPGDLKVDNTAAGAYPPLGSPGAVIPAGTVISSYFFDFDPVGSNTNRIRTSTGSVTFDRDILGVIFKQANLSATDCPIGALGTRYGRGSGRELALSSDTFTISPDRRTFSFTFKASGNQDNLRLILADDSSPTQSPLVPLRDVRPLDTPPPSVVEEILEDGNCTFLFLEKTLVLASDLVVDNAASGKYPGQGAPGVVIPAGTTVSSYFLHYDPFNDGIINDSKGSVTFDRQIIGVVFKEASLNATDALLGAIGTIYPKTKRGFDSPNDVFTIDTSHRVISFDFLASSGQDQLRIIVANGPPIANAGPDQSIQPGAQVLLDGSSSFDPEGDNPLSFAWSIVTRPAGSVATLDDPATVTPSFTADLPGDYLITLVVTDSLGNSSAADQVLVSTTTTTTNTPPVANAGPDQIVTAINSTVQLDGSASFDPNGESIVYYQWSMISKPDGSTTSLLGDDTPTPSFTVDVYGDYTIGLMVIDESGATSSPDTVKVTVNQMPVANAGPDQSAPRATLVLLDGSASFDPDGDLLSFSWEMMSAPTDSSAELDDPTSVTPTFTADLPGNYLFTLTVTDTLGNSSATDQMQVNVTNLPPLANAGPDQIITAINSTVQLDGSASDDPEGDAITYQWTLVDQPADSTASLTGDDTPTPSFIADVYGDYILSLRVTDLFGAVSTADTVRVNINQVPIADAGSDQSAPRGAQVELDGSASRDPDGNYPLSFAWSMIAKPAGSTATLDDPTSVIPSFTADLPGDYLITLVVTDALGNPSPADQVLVSTVNTPPVAHAGSDQSVRPGTLVGLDGSASFDPDNDYPLHYAWQLMAKPEGSTAVLDNADSVSPTFTADLAGDYQLILVVTDALGTSSVQDQVLVNTYNAQPVANAGPDQAIQTSGSTVRLDGRQSYDEDGDSFTYQWAFTVLPTGSNATLSGADSGMPSFIADVHGDYVIELTVTDAFGAKGSDAVLISFENIRPVADAGTNQAVVAGDTVFLDGGGSFDANLDSLFYQWNLVSVPTGSAASLLSPTVVQASFIADIPGTYVISLVVNDSFLNSDPSQVMVTAISVQTAVTEKVSETISFINTLSPDVFGSGNRVNALTNLLMQALREIEKGNYEKARDKLAKETLDKVDGCSGGNLNNDIVVDCTAQQQVYSKILAVIGLLNNLI